MTDFFRLGGGTSYYKENPGGCKGGTIGLFSKETL